MLAASEGLHRDMEVTAEGSGIKVPVGEKTLGRLFNVLGETIDDGEPIKDAPKMAIHREPKILHSKQIRFHTIWNLTIE